jgi:NADH dehydrogenase
MKIAITGANSRVGQTLIQHILDHSEHEVIAGARSQSAFQTFPQSERVHPSVISYDDVDVLAQALAGAQCLVHLAGILMEGKQSTYKSANVDATRAVVEAAQKAGVAHIVFISVVGASVNSSNAYFKSKADAEQIVAAASASSTIIRTPILLGPGAAGAEAIRWASSNAKPKLLGGGRYTMRPLDIDDLCVAIVNSCVTLQSNSVTHELVGPTPMQYCEIVEKAAGMRGKQVQVASFPIGIAKFAASVRGLFKPGGMSPTVIDVITMDEVVDSNADQALGVTLTPLQKTLEKFITQ